MNVIKIFIYGEKSNWWIWKSNIIFRMLIFHKLIYRLNEIPIETLGDFLNY